MLASLTKQFISQVKHNLDQLGVASTKDPMTMVAAVARYQESLKLLRMLPEMVYGKDKDNKARMENRIKKQLDHMEASVFSGQEGEPSEPQDNEEGAENE